MNGKLQQLLDSIQQSAHLSDDEKNALEKSVKEVDKEMEIIIFKLDRTEKVKRTTAILLEETIEELEQKRKAVEAQNRELEVEKALEKVRSSALAMKAPADMLDVCHIISEQLELLKVKEIRNVQTAIINEEKGHYLNFEFYRLHDKTFITDVDFKLHPAQFEFVHQMLKGPEEFFEKKFKGAEVQDWYAYQQTTNQFADSYLATASSLNYYWYSMGPVALGMSTYFPLNEEEIILFKRFRNVFELAYRRFLDIEKAEAQAREAQIEAALEKVRSRSLAMHTSTELGEVATVVLNNLQDLGYVIDSGAAAHLAIFSEDTKDFVQWSADPVLSSPVRSVIPYTDHPILSDFFEAKVKGLDFFAKVYTFEQKNTWFLYAFEHSDLKYIPEELKQLLLDSENYAHSIAIEKNSAIIINSITGNQLSENQIDILKRFARVFEQAYIRFLDLQKAEAQAREAQIETALERVRSRTMAMHNSNDLLQVIEVLKDQLQLLGFDLDAVNFITDLDQHGYQMWLATPGGKILQKVYIPRIEYRGTKMLEEAVRNKSEMVSYVLTKKEKDFYFRNFFENTELKEIPEEFRNQVYDQPGMAISLFILNSIVLTVANFKAIPLTTEQNTIVGRFAKVFEQSYTRFLDLQKAEAQAREAQIEAALERVRSRSLAMHQSDELEEVIMVVSEQLQQLQFRFHNASFVRYNDEQGLNFWLASPGQPQPYLIEVPFLDHPVYTRPLEALKKGVHFVSDVLTPEENHEWLDHLLKHGAFKNVSEEDKKFLRGTAGYARSLVMTKNIILVIGNYAAVPYTDEQNHILKRFGNVFEQAYTRFLDLQKAEAQAREAQIEAALERVRSASMAMHASDELQNVIRVLTDQLTVLGFEFHSANFITNASMPDWEIWISSPGSNIPPKLFVPYFDHRLFNERNDAVRSGKDMLTVVLNPEEKSSFLNYFFEHSVAKNTDEGRIKWVLDQPGMALTTVVTKSFSLSVINYHGKLYTEPENEVIKRLAYVFEQSYTRFLDLQKAEAQARESQIEAALERVRSRSMAMHKTDELLDAAELVHKELSGLGINSMNVSYAFVDEDEKHGSYYSLNPVDGKILPIPFVFPHTETEVMRSILSSWKKQESFNVIELDEKATLKHQTYIGEHIQRQLAKNNIPFSVEDFLMVSPKKAVLSTFNFSKGYLFNIGGERLSKTQEELILRFTKVFEQTYTRFLDLQKAEAQAREAKIEASLERVRAGTMAMYKSEDLSKVVEIVFKELDTLELGILRCGIGIINKENRSADAWITSVSEEGKTVQVSGNESMDQHPLLQGVYNSWLNLTDFSYVLEGEDLVQYYKTSGVGKVRLPDSQLILSADEVTTQYYQIAVFEAGGLFAFRANAFPEEAKMVMKRFAVVFNQSYTRFLDLQKAEAQAREAQIEVALERVRSKAMAMHKSEDLQAAVAVVFEELDKLDLGVLRVGISVLNKEKRCGNVWLTSTDEGKAVQVSGDESFDIHPLLHGAFEAWLRQEDFYYVLKNEDLVQYYKAVEAAQFRLPASQMKLAGNNLVQYCYVAVYNSGGLFAFRETDFPEEAKVIMRRFANVFDLTYKRFLDIQKAEAQAREARVEASLERVRAKAMGMHGSDDLMDTINLFYHEVEVLSITPRRCGVSLINKETRIADLSTMITTEDGGSRVSEGRLKLEGHWVLDGAFESWLAQKDFYPILKGNEIREYYKVLTSQVDFRDYPDDEVQYGYYFVFPEGLVFAWTNTELGEEALSIYRRFTSVLNLTYKRYKELKDAEERAQARLEDFRKLEEAKNKIEATLHELKATQTQLVQSEKMASLGELTAGIAHEIQNPLNFVNNFSEVSNELLDEMIEEVKKGNFEEVQAIVNDVKQNLEKINHHGKRADGIVKGMLQHSRSSSGHKEPTDINALADEYLRLAYHGLRAKDKSFNATMKTDFDESIGKINIIPQDIGRVILNLITNAFYVVDEKKKSGIDNYEPTVTVSTKRMNDRVGVRVKDNGNGVPQKILDKIFQPFFTTKPTGQGTGLGLSLSYDIVKAHGGELRVETTEGAGSQFTIELPVT